MDTKTKRYATDEEADNIPESPLSNCCGTPSRGTTMDGPSYDDLGLCPECRDHCDYGYYAEDLVEWFWDRDKKQFYTYEKDNNLVEPGLAKQA